MALPKELEQGLWQEIHKMEEEKKMEYVSSVERIGMEKEALRLLSRLIGRRFQVSSDSVQPFFTGLTTEQLEELGERFIEAENLDQIRQWADELRQSQ